MISFRLSVIALSAALIFSVGSSASTATTNYSHPEFSVTNDRTLNLRESGSQIVVEIIGDGLRQGGLALLGEGFQLDSSLSYHSGDNEGIEGDLDVVIPLWNGGRHAIFTQPGFVFWKGLEGEERFDGNIGLVYRAELTRGLIAGASVFYDHDFQIGHSRVSGGLDLQSGYFRLGANYYHPLSEVEDGREGFVEEALSGMDARLVFEREAVRLGSTIGYWDYKGEESGGQEDSRSGWKTSTGLDFGIRILPGVFAEASWERHKDNIVLDERIFAGLAFRFSLPDFEGASYGSGEMTSNLYKIVDREKRILYEEREADGILLTLGEGAIEEGGTVTVAIQLRKVAAEDVTLNFVGSGSATYGTDGDYTVSVGGTACTAVTGSSCSVTVATGETMPADNVVITINNDGRGEGAETIVLSTVVATGDASLTGRPLVLTIPEDPPLARASIVRTGSGNVAEGDTVDLDIQLGEMLEEDVTVNLVGSDSTATYGSSNDWTLSVGGTACTGVANDECQVSITAGQTSVSEDVVITINDDGRTNERAENIILSTIPDSGSTHLVQAGSSFTLNIPDDPPLPTVSISATSLNITEGGSATLTATLSETVTEDVVINLLEGGAADYGTSMDWHLNNGSNCNTATGTSCQITITAGQTSATATVNVNTDMTFEGSEERFTVEIDIASAGSTGVIEGSPSSLNFTIPAETPPTVSLNYSGSRTVQENDQRNSVVMTLELSEALSESVTLNLIARGTAIYSKTPSSGDYFLRRRVVAEGGTASSSVITTDSGGCTSATGTSCQVTFTAGQTIADIHLQVHETSQDGESEEDIILEVGIASAGSTGLVIGDPSNQRFTIPEDELPTVSLSYSGGAVQTFDTPEILVSISEALSQAVTLNIVWSGTAVYGGGSANWTLGRRSPANSGGYLSCNAGSTCQVTITAGNTTAEIRPIARSGVGRTMIVSIELPQASQSLVQLGNPVSISIDIVN